jgi:hypothetical protein
MNGMLEVVWFVTKLLVEDSMVEVDRLLEEELVMLMEVIVIAMLVLIDAEVVSDSIMLLKELHLKECLSDNQPMLL